MSTPFSIHGAPTTPLDFNFRSTTPMSKRTEPSPGPCKYDDLHTFYPRDPGQGLLRSTSFTPTDTINLNAAVAYREYIARTPSVQSFAATTPKASRSFNANANTNLTRRPGHLPPVCEEGSRFDYPAQDDYDSGSGSTAQYPPLGQFGHGSSYHGKVSAWIENLNQVIDESSNVHVPLWTPHMRDTIVKDKDGKFAQGIKIISNLLFAPSGNARVGTSRTEVDMEFDRQAREEYKKRMAQNQHLAGYVGESGIPLQSASSVSSIQSASVFDNPIPPSPSNVDPNTPRASKVDFGHLYHGQARLSSCCMGSKSAMAIPNTPAPTADTAFAAPPPPPLTRSGSGFLQHRSFTSTTPLQRTQSLIIPTTTTTSSYPITCSYVDPLTSTHCLSRFRNTGELGVHIGFVHAKQEVQYLKSNHLDKSECAAVVIYAALFATYESEWDSMGAKARDEIKVVQGILRGTGMVDEIWGRERFTMFQALADQVIWVLDSDSVGEN